MKKFKDFLTEANTQTNTKILKSFFKDRIKKYIPNVMHIHQIGKQYNSDRFNDYKKPVENFKDDHNYLIAITFKEEKVSMRKLKKLFGMDDSIKIYKPKMNRFSGELPRFIISFNKEDMLNNNVFKSLISVKKYNL